MGQTLSEPITVKETTSIKDTKVRVASSSMQGWRVSMEDAHQHILEMSPEDPDAAYFGVYDGHGGAKVAKYAAIHLHRYIVNRPEYATGEVMTAIREGFLECDRAMKEDEELRDEMAGATAITVLMKGDKLWCANAGDSRCIACIGGLAHPLSTDHKPTDPQERDRIEKAGGFVEFNRVNGNLALSRALGDFLFKMNGELPQNKQIVCADPDIEERNVTEDWNFLVLACDGIWDVLTNQQVCDFVLQRLAQNMQPELICEELMDRCLAPDCQVGGLGCDNMTVVLVCFLHGQPWDVLVEKCALLHAEREKERQQEIEKESNREGEENGEEFDQKLEGEMVQALISGLSTDRDDPPPAYDHLNCNSASNPQLNTCAIQNSADNEPTESSLAKNNRAGEANGEKADDSNAEELEATTAVHRQQSESED